MTGDDYSTLPDAEQRRIEAAFWGDVGMDVLMSLEDSTGEPAAEALIRWMALQRAWARWRQTKTREYLSRQPQGDELVRIA